MSKRTSERVVRNVAKLLVCAVVDQSNRAWNLTALDVTSACFHAQQAGLRVIDIHNRRRQDAAAALGALAMLPRGGSTWLDDAWNRVALRAVHILFKVRGAFKSTLPYPAQEQSVRDLPFQAEYRAHVLSTLGGAS